MSASARGIAAFDLDGTVAGGDTFKAYLRFSDFAQARLLVSPAVPCRRDRAVCDRSARQYSWAKCTLMAATFGGRPWGALARQTEAFIGGPLRHGIRRDALAAMADHWAAGRRLVLATASSDLYVVPLAQRLGFDDVVCTRVARAADGAISGKLESGNCYGRAKLERVLAWRAAAGIVGPMWVYSDHHADLPLLAAADVAFAISASRRLRAAAPAHGIHLVEWK